MALRRQSTGSQVDCLYSYILRGPSPQIHNVQYEDEAAGLWCTVSLWVFPVLLEWARAIKSRSSGGSLFTFLIRTSDHEVRIWNLMKGFAGTTGYELVGGGAQEQEVMYTFEVSRTRVMM